MTESNTKTSWLNGDVAKTTITGLIKKTGASQLKIGTTILEVKNKMHDLLKEKNDFLTKCENDKSTDALTGNYYAMNKQKVTDEKELIKKEYEDFINSLPFGKKVANKFIAIAEDLMIKKYIDIAPVAYNTLYEKCKDLNEAQWLFLKDKGLNAYTTASDVTDWKKEYVQLTATPETTEEEVNEAVDDANSIVNEDKTSIDTSDFKVEEETTEEVAEEVTEETTCNTCGEVECVCDEDEVEKGINDYNNANSNSISCIETVAFINASPNVSEDMLAQLNILLEEVIAEFVNEEGLDTDDLMLSMNPAVLIDNPNYDVKFDVAA